MRLIKLWWTQITDCRKRGHDWKRYELHGDARLFFGARYADQCLKCHKIIRDDDNPPKPKP